MASDDYLEIGQVAGVHGIHGAVLLRTFTENLDLFTKGETLLVKGKDSAPQEFLLETASPHKGKILARFKGVSDRNGAEDLQGRMILVPKDRLPELESGEFYWFELIGLDVVEKNGNRLGTLESIIETGSNDVYVVKDGKRETLVPALSWVVLSIDLEASTMVVDLPEGL